MSIQLPPELGFVAKIAVGDEFPKGNEDKLAELGAVWNAAAQEINQLLGQLNPSTAATFESMAGAPAEQFGQFVTALSSTLPVMATSAAQLGVMADNIALEIEYAKYMIILNLAWMAAEIAYLTATLFGSAAIPAVVTAGRFAVQAILRELFIAVLSNIVMQVGMDVAVQVIQFLKGDRTHWDLSKTKGAAEMGAIGGALGGGLGQIMRHLAPKFADSFVGNVTHGALTGLTTTAVTNVFSPGQNLGLGTLSEAIGGALEGGGRRGGHSAGDGVSPEHISVPKIDIPSLPDMLKNANPGEGQQGTPTVPTSTTTPTTSTTPTTDTTDTTDTTPATSPTSPTPAIPTTSTTPTTPARSGQVPEETSGQVPDEQTGQVPEENSSGQRPGEEELDLPDAPPPFDPSELPDPSPSTLVTDLPSAPTGTLPPLRQEVQTRVNELSRIARSAGLPESEWRPRADSVRESAGSGDWAETGRRLQDFRTTVEQQVLDQRLADFRAHVETQVDNGFSRLRDLGVDEDAWRSQVDAVEQAQRTGNPVLVDSQLKEYTDFVERHLPVEVVSENGPRSFDPGVEQLRRELTTVSDPAAREALQKDLEWHQQVQQRMDRLAQSDPDSDIMRRRTIAQEESARSPEEASQARRTLQDFQNQRDMQRQLDDVRQGTSQTDLERRLDALRERALPDARGQELLQRLQDAATPQETEQALRDLVEHNQLTQQERQLNELREGVLPTSDPQREQLVQHVENARTPEEARQAQQELREFTDRQIEEQQQSFTERLNSQEDARAQAADEDLLRRLDSLNAGTPQDAREAELRQQLDTATSPQERAQVIHELGVHQQGVLQQRVDAATTPQERRQALDAQAKFNGWTPVERRLADLRTVLNPGGAPEADAHRADLVRQVENARTPQEARQAQQELKQHTDRQIEEQTRHLEERLRQQASGGGQGSAAAAANADLMRRFEELRGDGSHQDPREAELMRRMEAADSPQEARSAEQQLKDHLADREQQRQVGEQQRLEQVRTHGQEATQLRDQLTQQRRTGAPEEVVQQTQQRLEQAEQRLATVRTPDENTAALRRELQQEIERPASGSDRPGAGSGRGGGTDSGGTGSDSGSGSRLDRLVQEGISRQTEQGLAHTQEEQQFLRQEPDERASFTLDE
ncbi:hypothetical protein, partial [Streptomyces sp. NPDC051738]